MALSRTMQAALLGSGKILANLGGLLSLAILARVFDKTDYATYRQTLLAYAFAAPVLTLGLPKALFYFLAGEKQRPRAVLSENLLGLALMGGVFALLIICGGNDVLAHRFDNPQLRETLLWLAPYPLLLLPSLALPACLMNAGKAKLTAAYQVGDKALTVCFIIGLTLVWTTPETAVLATTIGAGLSLPPALWLMYRTCPKSEGSITPTVPGWWSQVKYSVPLGLSVMVGSFVLNLDKVVVSAFAQPEDFAVYANGAMQLPLIGTITGSITAVILPEVSRAFKSGDFRPGHDLWKRAAAKCALVLFPCATGLFVFAPELMVLLFSEKYAASAVPFRVYLLLLPLRIARFDAVFMAAGKSRLILIRSLITLAINAILSVLMVQRFGPVGAAFATVISIWAFDAAFNGYFIKRTVDIPAVKLLPFRQLGFVFLAALGAALAVVPVRLALLPHVPVWGVLGLAGGLFGVLVLGIYHYAGWVKTQWLLKQVRERLPFLRRSPDAHKDSTSK